MGLASLPSSSTTIARITHWKGERRIPLCHDRSPLVSMATPLSSPIPDTSRCLTFQDSRSLRYPINVGTNSQ